MPDASRRESHRQARQQLHQRFLEQQNTPVAAPGAPEILFDRLPVGEEPVAAQESVEQDTTASAPVGRRKRGRRNLIMVVALLVFALVVTASVFTVRGIYKSLNPDDYPGPGGENVELTVEDGWGIQIISRKLDELDVVASDRLFVKAMEEQDDQVIHPGTYALRKQIPAAEAAAIMVDDTREKVFYVGITENVRLPAALQEIADSSGLPLQELQELANQPAKFGLPEGAQNLEGYLFPGGYRFPLETSAEEVLARMVRATTETLAEQGITDPNEGYRVLKIASILQAEAQPKDYATVAGALNNRLAPDNRETHGLLQVDSSVVYGLDRYTLQFTPAEKADASNPYNTYQHPGLPPTPIGSPAESAISAAVNPASNDYYYWVTVNIETGETKFASSYAEHQRNHQQFRDYCAANEGVCQ